MHINFVLDQIGVFSTHLEKSSYAFLNVPSLLIYDSDRFSYVYACLFLDDTHFEHGRRFFFLAVLCTYRICLDRVVV